MKKTKNVMFIINDEDFDFRLASTPKEAKLP